MMRFPLFALGLLVFLSLPLTAQEVPSAIKFSIVHNGHTKPVPEVIVLNMDGHTSNLLVQGDTLRVPVEFAHAPSFSLVTVIDREQIHIPELSVRELQYESWTIFLADHQYDQEHQAMVPKGEEVRTSCILALASTKAPAVSPIFVSYCRIKRAAAPTRRPSEVPIH
jgi:hypothetical protein